MRDLQEANPTLPGERVSLQNEGKANFVHENKGTLTQNIYTYSGLRRKEVKKLIEKEVRNLPSYDQLYEIIEEIIEKKSPQMIWQEKFIRRQKIVKGK
jgi:hypothetical protein